MKLKFKNVIILYNPEKLLSKQTSDNICKWLIKNNFNCKILTSFDRPVNADVCIVIGGDGTILSVGRKIVKYNIPVIGVNIGHLGFLAEFDCENIIFQLENLFLKSEYKVEQRILINVDYFKKNRKIKNITGINDCIIHSGSSTRAIAIILKINNNIITEYIGDGIIVSTPTGSTAYSLAANGPILYPDLDNFIITPICPHTLSHRPIVVSSDNIIVLELAKYKQKQESIMAVDSQEIFHFENGDRVVISKSKFKLNLITTIQKNYYNILRDKLKWG